MTPLFKDEFDDYKADLYKLIELKSLYLKACGMLTGSLITSVSANYIMNGDCGTSLDEMKKRHSDYEKQQKKAEEIKNSETRKVRSNSINSFINNNK